MHSAIAIKPAFDTPQVQFSAETGELLIKGRSMPEDATRFYGPLQEWLRSATQKQQRFELTMHLDYISSSSIKQLLRLLMVLEKAQSDAGDVLAIWLYHPDDEVMEMKGLELQSLVQIPFEVKEYNGLSQTSRS